MRTNDTTSFGVVKIAQLGSDTVEVDITSEEMTVKEVFQSIGRNFDEITKDVLCNSVKVTGDMMVDDGDILQIVAEKVDAGQ